MSERTDYQQQYKSLIERIDSQPTHKEEFERIAFAPNPNSPRAEWTRAKKNIEEDSDAYIRAFERMKKEGVDLAGNDDKDRAEMLYKQGLPAKLGLLEDVVKAYVAFGRVPFAKAENLAVELRFVTKRWNRLQKHPILGKMLNFFLDHSDYKEAHLDYDRYDWNELFCYASDKFPKLNPKHSEVDKPISK